MCEANAPASQGLEEEAGPGPASPLDAQCLGFPLLVGARKSFIFHENEYNDESSLDSICFLYQNSLKISIYYFFFNGGRDQPTKVMSRAPKCSPEQDCCEGHGIRDDCGLRL